MVVLSFYGCGLLITRIVTLVPNVTFVTFVTFVTLVPLGQGFVLHYSL